MMYLEVCRGAVTRSEGETSQIYTIHDFNYVEEDEGRN
jgi:hypothetical protein